MKSKTKKIGIYISIIILILIDQIIKWAIECNKAVLPVEVIKEIFKISYYQNAGIAFGIGVGNLIIFIIGNIVVLGILAKFVIGQNQRLDNKNKFVLSLVLAGGTSNLIDRVFKGHVIDFIQIGDFPIFNIADICICIGVIGFGISSLKYIELENKQKNKA